VRKVGAAAVFADKLAWKLHRVARSPVTAGKSCRAAKLLNFRAAVGICNWTCNKKLVPNKVGSRLFNVTRDSATLHHCITRN
jgi:hypothetical protein